MASLNPLLAVICIGLAGIATAASTTNNPTLSPTDQLAAYKAAGFKPSGKRMVGCDTEPEWPKSDLSLEGLDLNHDSLPEALINEGNSACYGNTGTAFYLVTRDAAGQWHRIAFAVGIPTILKRKRQGWPDIEVGGPGMGKMPVIHWTGKVYK